MKISCAFALFFITTTLCLRSVFSASCTLTGSSLDSLSEIKSSCTSITIKDFTVPRGETLDLTGLTKGTTVTFKGTIKFNYKTWSGPLVKVSGTDITIKGSTGHVLNGQGEKYWDGKGGNGGKTKPKFFKASKLYDSTIKDLNILNAPVHVFSIANCSNVVLNRITIDNSEGDSNGGKNTDGFNIGDSKNIHIKYSNVHNQDDCLAINSGSNINFTYNYCRGGHGISIGSVGNRNNNEVKNVYVKHCQVVDSTNGVRIKTVYGATGSVNGITYQNITLSNISKYGITIRGDYQNSGSVGTATSGVPIKNLTLKSISGSVQSSGKNIYVLVKGASNWKWSNINISGGKTSSSCSGIPSDCSSCSC